MVSEIEHKTKMLKKFKAKSKRLYYYKNVTHSWNCFSCASLRTTAIIMFNKPIYLSVN